jgi:hypothetical protein
MKEEKEQTPPVESKAIVEADPFLKIRQSEAVEILEYLSHRPYRDVSSMISKLSQITPV